MKQRLLTLVFLIPSLYTVSQINYTANDHGRVPAYSGFYRYGTNGGVYGPTWNDTTIADIAAGNPRKNVKGAGSKTFRPALPEEFLEMWGYDIRLAEFTHYSTLGVADNTVFLETPSAAHRDPNTYTADCGTPSQIGQSKVFKNLYEPIWDGGANGTPVNDNNYYALYVYKTAIRYKNFTKFWEIVNEPDQTHNGTDAAKWWTTNPAPCDLYNLKAPIFYYIRMLRISYEVIKSVDPNAYIAPGGLGFASFLDLILRTTDNPVDGSVTAQYPLTGGAYFDAMSFHGYPHFKLQDWENSIGGFKYRRHSDAAVEEFVRVKKEFDDVLYKRGYNGATYPKKVIICTENNISRRPFENWVGGDEVARNYMIKTAVESQKNDILQNYMFVVGDEKAEWEATDPFHLMGMFKKLNGIGPIGTGGVFRQELTNPGIAHKTTSDILFGFRYDAGRTASLNLPSNVKGGAFRNNEGKYIYVLWARTTADQSEAAYATYNFPAGIISPSVEIKYWDYTITNYPNVISSTNISLSGAPVFISEIGTKQAPNVVPVANAGADITITLPVNTVTLNGSASADPDGNIVKYEWSKVSGPERIDFVPITISTPNGISTTVINLIAGTYVYNLRVYDNNTGVHDDRVTVTVLPDPTPIPPNKLAIPNAGPDVTISTSSTTLNGSASYDPDGAINKYEWRYVSGPATPAIASPTTATTTVSNLIQGTYTFALKVWDNKWEPTEDQVKVTVGTVTTPPPPPPTTPPPTTTNLPPVPNAGADATVTLPANSLSLNGSATDPDGSINKYEWRIASGPAGASIANINSAITSVTGLVQGTYSLVLRVWDNKWEPAEDQVVITVNGSVAPPPPPPAPVGNQAPVSNAGIDQTITLPVNSVTLNGTGSRDPDGSIIKYEWRYQSGPSQYNISNINVVSPTVNNLAQGTYTFVLRIWDNKWEPAEDQVVINVTGATAPAPPTGNLAPVAKAGNDILLTLPANSATLNGLGSYDPDGSIIKYEWRYQSGPSAFNISNINIPNPTVSNLIQGTYVFVLRIWDNKWEPAESQVVVTVNGSATVPAPTGNMPPVSNAGADSYVALPGSLAFLNGTGSYDPDGSIIKYEWRKESGPASYLIENINSPATNVVGLVQGTYVFVLRIWDNKWEPFEDRVVVTVGNGIGYSNGAGIPEPVLETQLSLYPNPASTSINLRMTNTDKGKVLMNIYDVKGRIVKSQVYQKDQSAFQQQVQLASFTPGVYVVELITNQKIRSQIKFIKK